MDCDKHFDLKKQKKQQNKNEMNKERERERSAPTQWGKKTQIDGKWKKYENNNVVVVDDDDDDDGIKQKTRTKCIEICYVYTDKLTTANVSAVSAL
jgi:hypothetical protein